MRDFLRSVRLGAAWLMGLALLSPLAAQSPVDQPAAEGTANIYNLDRDAGIGGVEIHGPITKAVTSQAVQLIRSIRTDVDELTVFLSSPGGDVLAAMELGEEIRKQWAWTAVDEQGECYGACVLVLAAGRAGLGVEALVVLGHDDVAVAALPGHLVEVASPGFPVAQLARHRQAAAVAGIDVHVALGAPAGALLGRTLVLDEDAVDGHRRPAAGLRRARTQREDRQHGQTVHHG